MAGLHRLVEPGSVDIMITNPHRGFRSLPSIPALAAFADHALKPTGAIAVTSGICNLAQVFELLMLQGLEWVAELNYPYGNRGDLLGPPDPVQPTRNLSLNFGNRFSGRTVPTASYRSRPPDETAQTSATNLRRYDAGNALIAERCCSPR